MKNHCMIAALSALSLAACGKSETPAPAEKEAKAATTPAAKADTPPAAPPTATGTPALTPELLTGKWAMESDGDCLLAQEFKADGSVVGLYERWKLDGSNLIVSAGPESITVALKVVDADRIQTVTNGKTDHLVRC